MRIIVTGGSGRLGQSVVRGLHAAGHEVISIDRVEAEDLPVDQRQADLIDAPLTRALFGEIRPDAVIHLAGIATPFSAPEAEILRVNSGLTFSVLEAAVGAQTEFVLVASSPTIMGYGNPAGWTPKYLPLDEDHPVAPWHAYGLSKQVVEDTVAYFVRSPTTTRFGIFRPCFIIAPEEWHGSPTQQGHSITDRLADPSLAAVSLFNYVDARDVAEFIRLWLERATDLRSGEIFFVSAADALAVDPLATLVPRYLPGAAMAAEKLTGSTAAFTSDKAGRMLGWAPRHSWRTELPQLAEA